MVAEVGGGGRGRQRGRRQGGGSRRGRRRGCAGRGESEASPTHTSREETLFTGAARGSGEAAEDKAAAGEAAEEEKATASEQGGRARGVWAASNQTALAWTGGAAQEERRR